MLLYYIKALSLTSVTGLVLADDNKNVEKRDSSNTEIIVIAGSRKSSEIMNLAGNVDRISTEDIN